MPFEGTKKLELNQYQKSDKLPFIIYADLECIIKKVDKCKIIPENSSTVKVSEYTPSSTVKVSEYTPSDFSMPTISLLRSIENNHVVYRV